MKYLIGSCHLRVIGPSPDIIVWLDVILQAAPAAQAGGDSGIVGLIIAGVTVGATVLGLLTKQLYTKAHVDDLRADKVSLQAQVSDYSKQYNTVIMPTMHDTIRTVQALAVAAERQQLSADKMEGILSRMNDSIAAMGEAIRIIERTRP